MQEIKTAHQQLSDIKKIVKDDIKDPSPSPMKLAEDGVDHINTWEQAETEIGKFLAHSSTIPFKHDIFGKFNTMESFWVYIQSEEKDDRIRVMSGRTLKNFSKKLNILRITNFRAIIMDANWQKVKQHKHAMQAIKDSTVPFDCYYINSTSGIRVRPTFFKWLIRGFEEIRKAIKEDREPSFNFLLDKKDTGIYDFVVTKHKQSPVAVVEALESPVVDQGINNLIDHLQNELELV